MRSDRIRELCAKLVALESGPEFDALVSDLERATEDYLSVNMTELVRNLSAERDPEKKLAMIEDLKELLDDEQRRKNSAKA